VIATARLPKRKDIALFVQRRKDLGSVVLVAGEPGAWSYDRKGTANTYMPHGRQVRNAVSHPVRAD
jgi:hypothetical protein